MTTGSLVLGLADGLNKGPSASGTLMVVVPTVTYVQGNPNNLLTCAVGSDYAIDISHGNIYIGLTAAGSSWLHLGSVS